MQIVFDINETLLDIGALDDLLTELTGVVGARSEWFDLVIRTALTVTASDRYEDFAAIGAASLRTVAARYGRPVLDTDIQRLGAGMRALPPHPDAPVALARLASAGAELVALGNSPLAVIQDQLRHSGLDEYLGTALSAERAGRLKPSPAAYRLVTEATGRPLAEAVMVAAHDWDISGARAAGMRTAFVARGDIQPSPVDDAPDYAGADLIEIADALTR